MPWGMSFNETTGTFTGTPTETGEYVVPVRVQTNYGQDQKDVYIVVENPASPVYAIGAQAATWSENAEPDAYGFRMLPMPNAHKLTSNSGGFLAMTAGSVPYCCGTYNVLNRYGFSDANQMFVKNNGVPLNLTINDTGKSTGTSFTGVERIITGTVSHTLTANNQIWTTRRVFVWHLKPSIHTDGNVYYSLVAWYGSGICHTQHTDGSYPGTNYLSGYAKRANEDWGLGDGGLLFSENLSLSGSSFAFLSNFGTRQVTVRHSRGDSTTGEVVSLTTTELGYKALKYFGIGAIFKCLSEDKLLDNDAGNFTIGIIRDAWVHMQRAYVLTDNNNLYERQSTGAWNLQGNYDVKKLLMPAVDYTLMLTRDGRLYHKGTAIEGVTEAHDVFTHIYPDCNFYDMAYDGSNTLTVIRK